MQNVNITINHYGESENDWEPIEKDYGVSHE